MKVIAHRGASAYAPQNTAPAFEMAKSMHADGIECDIHKTKDGHLVVCHDAIPSHACGHDCPPISAQTLAQLKALDFSYGMAGFSGTKIITLDEMLEIVSGMEIINIEIKTDENNNPYPGIVAEVKQKANLFQCLERVLISSFAHELVAEAVASGMMGAILYGDMGDMKENAAQYASRLGVNGIHPFFGSQTQEKFEQAHQAGLFVNAWTVDEPDDMLKMVRWGADGIITNKPDIAVETVK